MINVSRIFVTGQSDTHGPLELNRLSNKNFPLARELNKSDTLLITGDAGFMWSDSAESKYWDDWAEDRPFSIMSCYGNHSNYSAIRSLPITEWNGAKVRMVRSHVGYIENGEIFNLNNFSFFCMGGARSVDKGWRTENVTWWSSEMPSFQELDYGARNLAAHNMSVDFILSHCGPTSVVKALMPNAFNENDIDPLMSFFEKYIKSNISFQAQFMGHYHQDRTILDKYHILYNDIIEIMPDGTLEMRNSQYENLSSRLMQY